MRTSFRCEQLADPHMRDAERALRTCVHCGFCTATCPTYVLLADECDSPRGRIMLMQQMLESGAAPNAETVLHLDRCLSCLGCRSACPSGVDYAALIDQSRVHIEEHYTRPLPERLFRNFILLVLTRPALFAVLSAIARAFAPVLARLPGRLGSMSRKAARTGRHRSFLTSGLPIAAGSSELTRTRLIAGREIVDFRLPPPGGEVEKAKLFRVGGITALPPPANFQNGNSRASPQGGGAMPSAVPSQSILLLPGCVQRALAPEIDDAVTRVLVRENRRVDCQRATGCCGALAFHLGKAAVAKQQAKAIIRACEAAEKDSIADAVLISASGCTAFLKDYGNLFADDPQWKSRAEHLAAKARDFVEIAMPAASPSRAASDAPVIAFHPPCSLQHGQRISGSGEALLRAAGFRLAAIPDVHLCCGSAGSYSLLQPEIAERLRAKKLDDIKSTGAAVIVSDNIGCLTHLAGELPVLHIAELLDWSQSGDEPPFA